ncbi:DNA independent RNA polymerase I transcription factor [Balamuthia mandrillaris]
MLVQNLQPRKGKGGAAEVEVSERIFKYIHQAIARVLELAPTSITPLFSALSANFPHRRLDVDTQRFYLSNLLQLTQYCPALRGSVLSIAVKKALELDVEIELALVAEDEEEEEEEFLFDLEINGEARRQEQSEMANKLDVLMGLLFRHLQSLTEGASYEERHELFSFMLQIFDSMIIKTHKSKYTQFLMFYLCWTEEPFAQNFLGYLLNKILDPSNHTLTRQTCAAYVGGFLARASFLSADVMQQTLNVLATWCQNYLDSCTRNIPDAELHALFYSVCQAIFYAVCFKHSAFLLTEDAKQHFASLQLEDIIESSLNPFKFCTISVVREFARVTSHYSALSAQCDCTALIERNQRLVLPTKTVFGGLNQMEAFFPFDPYLLRQSSVFVQDIYQTWSPPENTTPYNGENNNSETEDSQKGTGRLRSSSDVLLSTSAGMAIASYSPSPALLPSPLRLRSHASAIPIAAAGSASPSASASEPASSFEEHGFTPEATLDIDFKLSWDGAL